MFRNLFFGIVFIAGLALTGYAYVHAAETLDGRQVADDVDYDRLDGKGLSGKKVNVIEWEGNLEIHVYPAGSLKGLALKLDKTNKAKPVMVIGYRFDNAPAKQLIRRAILTIDLQEGFKAYRDPSAGDEYDKIVISNQGLSSQVVAFKLDPPPAESYPEEHPTRKLAGERKQPTAAEEPVVREKKPVVVEEGQIKPFEFR
jgi:hypothetical protein